MTVDARPTDETLGSEIESDEPGTDETPDSAAETAEAGTGQAGTSETTGDADAPEPVATAGRRRPSRWAVAGAIACLALTALVAVQALSWRAAEQQDRDTATASRAAQTGVAALLTYDYRTITTDIGKAKPFLTPAFAGQYDRVATTAVIPAATSSKVITSATVTGTSVVSTTKNTVVLLMFINQSSTATPLDKDGKAGKAQRSIDLSRVRVSMQRVGDTWRINDLRGI